MDQIVCVEDFEKEVIGRLNKSYYDFFVSGADEEITLNANKRAFKEWIIRPRMLVDVSKRNLSTSVLEKSVNLPIGISPMALQKLAHPEGELALVKAAENAGTIFILSSMSNCSVEEVAAAAPTCRKWFQLYVFKNRKLNEDIIKRVEKCGFEALVLTVDAPLLGKRRVNIRNKFKLPKHLNLGNFQDVDASEFIQFFPSYIDPSLNWEDIAWIRKISKLPVILKGILTREDAELCLKYKVDGIFVSNHGGRQLDTVLPSLEALKEVVDAVGNKCEIYVDGGVRNGTDVYKALALGAKMVFVGRPFLWGLTLDGFDGAEKVLKIYRDELDSSMALSGTPNINDIKPSYVSRCHNMISKY